MSHPYLPNTEDDRQRMLDEIGIERVDQLFEDIPVNLREKAGLDILPALTEPELLSHIRGIAERNSNVEEHPCFLGAGVYDHFIPSIVPHLIKRSEFYTAYTPYQPEASQGTLQAMFEFQSMLCQLTEMDAANASLYDGASALAEAVLMTHHVIGRKKVVMPKLLHPHYSQVVKTHGEGLGLEWSEASYVNGVTDTDVVDGMVDDDTACVVVQHPNFLGSLENVSELQSIAHRSGALLVVVFDPISLGLLKSPGEYCADIAVAEGQPLGIPLQFGGPLVGLFACREQYVRHMPGRIVGETLDANSERGFVLTLQTREQHIRRERATSNICTNQSLMALAAAIYISVMGPHGFRETAELCVQKAHYAVQRFTEADGFSQMFPTSFFKEFVLRCPIDPLTVNARLKSKGLIGGLPLGQYFPELKDCLLVCVTEKRTVDEIDRFTNVLKA